MISALAEAERSLGELEGLAGALPSPHVLVRPFVRREAVRSSRIEGTRASLWDLYAYEAARLSFLEPGADVREVHNYVRALEHGLERLDSLPIGRQLIEEIHNELMTGVRGEHLTPGAFRKEQNWIGPPGSSLHTATYVPPPVEAMHAGLDALEAFLQAPSEIPPLVQAGLAHYQFEALHPFLDGNGRVGRLLVILLLVRWGLLSQPWLYLSAFFEAYRSDYYELLLGVSRRGDWQAWLTFFLRGVVSQARDAVRRIERLGRLRSAFQEQLEGERAAGRLMQAVDALFERPILNIRQLEAALGVPYRSAQRYVERLEALGILREVTGRARNRIYQADLILEALEEPAGPSGPASAP